MQLNRIRIEFWRLKVASAPALTERVGLSVHRLPEERRGGHQEAPLVPGLRLGGSADASASAAHPAAGLWRTAHLPTEYH